MNKFGIGAKAYLFTKNEMQYQELMLTRGFKSSSEPRLHFGLDTFTRLIVLIVWPDQKYQLLKNIPANKQLTFHKKMHRYTLITIIFFPKRKNYLKILAARLTVIGNIRKMILLILMCNI